jgi:origin recognition complex subunit 4
MSDISKDHREHFHVVRLNGFIHTDDKLALREIWRQLGREMEVDDDLTSKVRIPLGLFVGATDALQTNSYADTLASLLALLSHPSEISEDESNQTAKSVIFILDEFDLFTSHPRQTLLYNLFDIAQARKAPIAVLGLTTKIDVVERLEKRVKSRFSHRYVHLPLPKNLAMYWEICRQGLLADEDELEEEGFTTGLGGQDEFRSFWESMINVSHNYRSFPEHS